MDKYNKVVEIVVIAIILIILAVTTVITAVNAVNKIDEGIIVDKQYHSAYTTTNYIYNGNTRTPYYQYHSERYTFTIEGKKNDKTVQYCFEVTQDEYSQYKVGDYYKS